MRDLTRDVLQIPASDDQRSIMRMMGAVLGDAIRQQDGEEGFRQIEDIRRASVTFDREGSAESAKTLADQL